MDDRLDGVCQEIGCVSCAILIFAAMGQAYPVLEILPELQATLAKHTIAILQAPPGAGKSTVLPLELMQEPWLQQKKIILLEPRRLAARSVAERLADLLDENVGERVGFRVRFETKVSARTQIEVVTEGILTRMIQSDNSLEEAGLIIFDEFHERSLHADLALALCLQLQQVLRDDLRILIMSATLDGAQLSNILGGAPVITSQGRQYPVTLRYAGQDTDTPAAPRMAQAIRRALREETEGDVLAFLPGTGEIKRTQELLEEESVDAVLYPLYGDLSFAKQQEAILPRRDGRRKVVLATSIAETSLTIEGIRIVVDSGLARVPRFDPRSGAYQARNYSCYQRCRRPAHGSRGALRARHRLPFMDGRHTHEPATTAQARDPGGRPGPAHAGAGAMGC